VRSSHLNLLLVVLGATLTLVVMIPAAWMGPTRFTAWAAGIQACAVLVTFSVGAISIGGDRRERRVERSLRAHEEYETGTVCDPRQRLSRVIRGAQRAGTTPISAASLREDTQSVYGSDVVGGQLSTPARDLAIVLNYFDRLLKGLRGNALDRDVLRASMLHHVAWWLKNLTELESFAAGRSLQELADDLGR
jgi:hypothetical protein